MRHTFYLNHPAADWEHGLPVGNGRLGAVCLGGVDDEKLILNEESVWYGGPRRRMSGPGREKIDEIRKLILDGEVEKAQRMSKLALTSRPKNVNPYQPAGDLNIRFFGEKGELGEYCRKLDLDNGEAEVSYKKGEIHYVRTCFASVKAQVLVLRMEAEKAGKLSFYAHLGRRPFEENSGGIGTDRIYMTAHCGDGVSLACMAGAAETDGRLYTENDYLVVEDASFAVLYVAIHTDYDGRKAEEEFVPGSDLAFLLEQCGSTLDKAYSEGYEKIHRQHRKDYKRLNERTRLQLVPENSPYLSAESEGAPALPVDELLARSKEPEIRKILTELLIAYGKYLLISSSYQCQLPANLQGIWNGSYTPPWESGYTVNINLQMNYWFADKFRLYEMYEPFTALVCKLLQNGKRTAREVYGCGGSVAHHNTNLWGDSAIGGTWDPGSLWPFAGEWLTCQLYNHFCYTADMHYLTETVLPLLEENLKFLWDYLYRDASGKWLTGPGVSPENTYRTKDGQEAAVTMGCTMDNQLVREAVSDYLAAWNILESRGRASAEPEDLLWQRRAREILEHLPETSVGSDGRILEWREAYEETEPGHRHMSHLYGLHPGKEITRDNPVLCAAAEKTLAARLAGGGGHTGWSRAWLICFYAMLGNGNEAYKHLGELMSHSLHENLWDVHPPFQIDGNFGLCEGIAQMLVQCRENSVTVLPALPDEWREGRVEKMGIAGGAALSFGWKTDEKGKTELTFLEIEASKAGCWKLLAVGKEQEVSLEEGECRRIVETVK